jgi:GT2 family glycosyltransferase
MPAYNRASYIGEAIESVLNQTCRDLELIVVDDGSSDNTAEVVAGFKDNRVKYIYQTNSGMTAARNTGIAHVLDGRAACEQLVVVLTIRLRKLTAHHVDAELLPAGLSVAFVVGPCQCVCTAVASAMCC